MWASVAAWAGARREAICDMEGFPEKTLKRLSVSNLK
jgi:hypothetical protein